MPVLSLTSFLGVLGVLGGKKTEHFANGYFSGNTGFGANPPYVITGIPRVSDSFAGSGKCLGVPGCKPAPMLIP